MRIENGWKDFIDNEISQEYFQNSKHLKISLFLGYIVFVLYSSIINFFNEVTYVALVSLAPSNNFISLSFTLNVFKKSINLESNLLHLLLN